MKELLQTIKGGAIMGLIAGPFSALAQSIPDEPPPATVKNFQGLLDIINRFLGWLFTLLIVVAAIFIVMAAFYYLTAGGDEEKVKKAKNQLVYAVVAIAVGLLATSVKFIVGTLIGTPPGVIPEN